MNNLEEVLQKYMLLLQKVESKPELFALAKDSLGSDDAAIVWLISPHIQFNGQAPISRHDTQVRNLLLAIEYGIYL